MIETVTLLTMAFLFTGARLNVEPAQSARRVDLQPMAFVTYIHYPYQEDAAAMLVDSIRAWGGEYRDCPIYAVLTDPKSTGLRLKDKNVQLVPLELEESVRKYPFAAKAYAAAKIESLIAGKARSLAWFDPETMLLRPPREMDLKDGISAAVAPVAFINTGQTENEPLNAYWAAIYKKCSLDPKKLFIVETRVDCKKVRAWLNCGMFAVRADRGLCREWAKVLDEFYTTRSFSVRPSQTRSTGRFCTRRSYRPSSCPGWTGGRFTCFPPAITIPCTAMTSTSRLPTGPTGCPRIRRPESSTT
jgi:hypothetical protein